MRWSTKDAGLSLLELAAVMAIFSVVALMGVQLLTQAMANRGAIAHSDARVAALTAAVAVLRRDLEQAVPQPDATGEAPMFAMTDGELQLETGADGGSATVTWRVNAQSGTLERRVVDAEATTLRLSEVAAFRGAIFTGTGWIEGAIWRPQGPADLPVGMRIVLVLDDLGEIPVVVAR